MQRFALTILFFSLSIQTTFSCDELGALLKEDAESAHIESILNRLAFFQEKGIVYPFKFEDLNPELRELAQGLDDDIQNLPTTDRNILDKKIRSLTKELIEGKEADHKINDEVMTYRGVFIINKDKALSENGKYRISQMHLTDSGNKDYKLGFALRKNSSDLSSFVVFQINYHGEITIIEDIEVGTFSAKMSPPLSGVGHGYVIVVGARSKYGGASVRAYGVDSKGNIKTSRILQKNIGLDLLSISKLHFNGDIVSGLALRDVGAIDFSFEPLNIFQVTIGYIKTIAGAYNKVIYDPVNQSAVQMHAFGGYFGNERLRKLSIETREFLNSRVPMRFHRNISYRNYVSDFFKPQNTSRSQGQVDVVALGFNGYKMGLIRLDANKGNYKNISFDFRLSLDNELFLSQPRFIKNSQRRDLFTVMTKSFDGLKAYCRVYEITKGQKSFELKAKIKLKEAKLHAPEGFETHDGHFILINADKNGGYAHKLTPDFKNVEELSGSDLSGDYYLRVDAFPETGEEWTGYSITNDGTLITFGFRNKVIQ